MPYNFNPIVPATNDNQVQAAADELNRAMERISQNVDEIEQAFEEFQKYVSKSGLAQTTGQDPDNAMSQKAATDAFALKSDVSSQTPYVDIPGRLDANVREIYIPGITSLNQLTGKVIYIKSSVANTNSASINVNSIASASLIKVKADNTISNLAAGDLPKDWVYMVTYVPAKGAFFFLNPPIQASGGTSDIPVYDNSGSENTWDITVPDIASYNQLDGKVLYINPKFTNTSPVIVDINGLGSKPLNKVYANGQTDALTSGDINVNSVYTISYYAAGNYFVLLSPALQTSGGGGTGNPTVYNDAGTPGVRTVTIPDVSNFSDMEGKLYFIKAFANSAGSTTLNVNNFGAKQMLKFNQTANSTLVTGDLRQGMVYAITVLGNSIYVITPSIQIASNNAIGGVIIQNDPQGASGIPYVVGMQMFNQYEAAIQDQFGDLNALTLNMVYPQVINDFYAIGDPIDVPQSDYDTLKDIERQYTINDMQFYRQLIVKQINPYSGREICNKFDLVAYGNLPSDYNYEDPESHIDHYNLMGGLRQIVLDSDSPIWKGTLRDPYDTQWYTALIRTARVQTSSDGEVRTWVITVYRNSGGGVMEFYRLLMPSFCPNPNGSPDMDNVDSFIGIKSPIYHRYRDVDYYAALKGDNTYDPDNRQYVPQPENIKSNGIPWDVQVYGIDDDVVRPTLTINEYLVWLGLYNALKFNGFYPQLTDV